MKREWDADFSVTDEDAVRLIESQFPEFAPASLELMGVGWDNCAYRVNGDFVFRFPRRKMAVDLMRVEASVLPRLGGLPLAIPLPEWIGAPTEDYPCPFAGYRLIEGETADRVDLSLEDRASCAAPLGEFLKALHSLPVLAGDGPGDELRRADLGYRIPKARERVLTLEERWRAPALAYLDQIEGADCGHGPLAWVHGDLYARHILVDSNRTPRGVIDWGDMHVGDPALDLSIAYSFLPVNCRNLFWEAYGQVDEAAQLRARFRAVWYGAVLIPYGEAERDMRIKMAGETALLCALDI